MGRKRKASAADIRALKNALVGTDAEVFGPCDEGYSATLERWSQTAEKPAGVSVLPSSAEEVSVAVKYATENGLDLAVKGGGHSTSGASSTDGGVLVNLGRMRHVKVDPEKKVLFVQGGALWHDVDTAAWQHGLATVGGTVADTGVGGLTLGGGYGYLSGQHGLVIDNVVSATIVLASGEIKETSNDENPDLFWALLGTGQNFGVTTSFVLRAYEQGEVFTGTMVFRPTAENVKKIVTAANHLYQVNKTADGPRAKSRGRSSTVLLLEKHSCAESQVMIRVVNVFFGTEPDGRALLKPFFDMEPLEDTMAMQPYPNINNHFPNKSGMRISMKGVAFALPLREEFVGNVIATYNEFITTNRDAADTLIAWEFFDATEVLSRCTGSFANRGYHLNGFIAPVWSSRANDHSCRQWAGNVANMFKDEMQKRRAKPGKGEFIAKKDRDGEVVAYGNYDVSLSKYSTYHMLLLTVLSKISSDPRTSSEKTMLVYKTSRRDMIPQICSTSFLQSSNRCRICERFK